MKILIIGLGSIAKKHIDAIKKINPSTEIIALRSNSNSFLFGGIINIYNVSEIPSNIDFILISNPTSLHAEAISSIIHLEKPIFIEKPVFDTLLNKDKLIKILLEKNIKTYVGCNFRFHPAIIFLKNYLRDNQLKINEINIYCGSYLPNWRLNQDYTKSYSSNKFLGGGVHLDLIHELDFTIWIFGEPANYTLIKRKVSNLLIDSVDYCHYNLIYPDFNVNITLNYYRSKPKREIEIVFENEILVCDLLTSTIINCENKILFQDVEFNFSKTYLSQMNYFINNLENRNDYMNNIQESIRILKIAIND